MRFEMIAPAWAVLCCGLYGSFFYQLESGASHDVSGLANSTVVLVKGALYAVPLVGLALSVRAAAPPDRPAP